METLNINEIRKWEFYKPRAKNYPSIPAKVQTRIKLAREKGKFININFKTASEIISLKSFRKRVSNYEQQHLPSQKITKFNPNFVFKKKVRS